jgi:pyrimidine deaminase RibD-like protein
MRFKEFTNNLDSILVELARLIVDSRRELGNAGGDVGACVLTPTGNKVVGISIQKKDGSWMHAERVAIDKYLKQYGDIPADSILITTLSPCSEHMDDRHGSSCTDLIEHYNIKKVYCGYNDPTQDHSDNYDHKHFNVQLTDNEKLQDLCKSFADTFLPVEAH